MAKRDRIVFAGVDTHKDVHVAAVVDGVGKLLATASFTTDRRGLTEVLSWMTSFGQVARVGVEGTGTYGAGLARQLGDADVTVVEVNRPNRQLRQRRGKSDTVDAEAAARAALNGEATVVPKMATGIVESIRVLRVAHTSARKHRTQVALQIRDLVVTAPDVLRAKLGPLSSAKRVEVAARFQVTGHLSDPVVATKAALRRLARRYEALSAEMADARAELDALTTEANPALRAAPGVGADVAAILLTAAGGHPERIRSEAAFAALCGVSPVQASSGKTVRHRLNRSGNRQANHALWRIVFVRKTCDPRTKAYVARRRAEGKSDREITRCLKRYVAREVFSLLLDPPAVHSGAELRTARRAAGISALRLTEVLELDIHHVYRLEQSHAVNPAAADRYLAALSALVDLRQAA